MTSPDIKKGPDFICIGAMKAGTTWLYEQLKQHPEVWLPPVKQINYFDEKEEGLSDHWYSKIFSRKEKYRRLRWRFKNRLYLSYKSGNWKHLRWDVRYFLGKRNDAWYRKLFLPEGNRISGDVTPDYSALSEETVNSIAKAYPHVKILLILRNPAERLWSHLRMVLGDVELQENTSNIDVWKRAIERASAFGNYHDIIERWSKAFGKDRFHIYYYDDLALQPDVLLNRICADLNIAPMPKDIDLTRVFNKGDERMPPGKLRAMISEHCRAVLDQLVPLELPGKNIIQQWRSDNEPANTSSHE
ncbi:MAG: sulfotransferase [Flavobacteriales bacterium]|nr:sulfotransferase [Flavobacteriales bacterium]